MHHTDLPGNALLHQAQQRIKPYVNRTPLLRSDWLNEWAGAELWFKCENLQRVGAFKPRGAFNATLQLSAEEKHRGVATHSSGNHAQALALVAKTLGIQAHIVMPENSPASKIAGVRELGGEITFCEATVEAREAVLKDLLAKTGATYIPPYDHMDIIIGQSTAALEIFEDVPGVENVLVPLGGGGLLSGTALAAKYNNPGCKVYGAEPLNVNDGERSLKSGTLCTNPPGSFTVADGLRTNLGELPFEVMKLLVHDVLTAREETIAMAMELIWRRLKVIVEPSGALALAVLHEHRDLFKGQRVALILSGGNVDWSAVPFLK
ncbi:MAG: pyridoxal-phosphate dependent enzyme [Cryomorphaceae bacterium]|nr:MAG: pyridoxal-phosphate dependent enzyme [Cryomorphaceae bacterium]